ncbi:MAG: desulfoferrodoxin FeS4 iron-binding domain-containing protein [archaeon]
MTKINQIYKCDVCGNIVEVLHEAGGTLVCCGEHMKLLHEKTSEDEPEKGEKHVPIIHGKKVKIGAVPHPMEETHYIEWIEAFGFGGEFGRVFLMHGDKPEAEFCFEVESARELCNLHGLWTSE